MAFLSYLSPFRYVVRAFHTNEFVGLLLQIDPESMGMVIVLSGEAWLDKLGLRSDCFFFDLGVLVVYSSALFLYAYHCLIRRMRSDRKRNS